MVETRLQSAARLRALGASIDKRGRASYSDDEASQSDSEDDPTDSELEEDLSGLNSYFFMKSLSLIFTFFYRVRRWSSTPSKTCQNVDRLGTSWRRTRRKDEKESIEALVAPRDASGYHFRGLFFLSPLIAQLHSLLLDIFSATFEGSGESDESGQSRSKAPGRPKQRFCLENCS